jgi:hypothetical protein
MKLKYTQKAGIKTNISDNEKTTLKAIISYERDPNRTRKVGKNIHTIKYRIKKLLQEQSPLKKELIVWRGQYNNKINPDSWFSTSLRKIVSQTYGGRCIFKIHLEPGIKCIDLYKFYKKYNIINPSKQSNNMISFLGEKLNFSNDYSKFEEVIVEQGGTFWKDKEHTEKGFKEIGKTFLASIDLKKEFKDQPLIIYETFYSVN